MLPLRIELLGNLRITYGQNPVTSVNTNRLQSLLALLVLNGDVQQSREHLAFLLWPESGESQARFDALYPPGLQWYWKADFVKELGDEAIALHVKHGSQLPTMHSTMHLYPVNGAAHNTAKSKTPWNYRDAVWSQVIVGVDPDPANKDRITAWARDYWEALHPFGAGGAYVNFMMEEGEDRIRATYGENYDRLASIKAQYDPGNFFRVNQNIPPETSSKARAT